MEALRHKWDHLKVHSCLVTKEKRRCGLVEYNKTCIVPTAVRYTHAGQNTGKPPNCPPPSPPSSLEFSECTSVFTVCVCVCVSEVSEPNPLIVANCVMSWRARLTVAVREEWRGDHVYITRVLLAAIWAAKLFKHSTVFLKTSFPERRLIKR